MAATATTELGAMSGEDSELKQKTLKKIQELQQQLLPSQTTSGREDSMAMEIDTMSQGAGKENKEGEEQDDLEMANSLFFMEPDHEGIRDMEDQEVWDYWEAGIMSECLSALKSEDIDHSWVLCYHCSRRGHIKANCLARKSASTRLWKGRAG